MSKKDRDQGGIQKPVALPGFPKYDDNHRDKWSSEYDKVEAELLKNHVTAPNSSTTTLGLRLLSSNFDRSVPDTDDQGVGGGYGRSRTTDPYEGSTKHGQLSPIRSHSPGRSAPRRRPRSEMEMSASHNVTCSFSEGSHRSATDIGQTMMTLLDPPLRFRTSFTVDTEGIDLEWLRKVESSTRPVPRMVTLETVREDRLINPSAADEAALNSPRSIFLLLRNGLSVKKLQTKPISAFRSPAVSEDAAITAHGHFEERRRELLLNLREEYRAMSEHISLNDVLDSVVALKEQETGGVSSTLVQATKSKQKQADDINREKMNRQRDFIQAARERVDLADQRRVKNEKELLQRNSDKKTNAQKMADAATQRQRELQQSSVMIHQTFLQKVENRRLALEAKEAAREKAQQEQKAKLAQENEERTKARQERLDVTRQHMSEMLRKQEEDFTLKEKEAAERKAQQDAEKAKKKETLKEQQFWAEERRLQAKDHAREHELAEARRAEEKRLAAENKLNGYFNEREKQRDIQRRMERQKEQERQQKRRNAEQKLATKRDEILHKRQEHDVLAAEMRRDKEDSDFHTSMVQKCAQDDKGFYVDRKANANEFQKLISVGSIMRKQAKAEAISRHRQELLKATLMNREQSRLEQEKFAKEVKRGGVF